MSLKRELEALNGKTHICLGIGFHPISNMKPTGVFRCRNNSYHLYCSFHVLGIVLSTLDVLTYLDLIPVP